MGRNWLALAGIAKTILFLAATIFLVWAFAQTVPFDIAIWFAADTLTYIEIVSAVWLASRVASFRSMAGWMKSAVRRRLHRPRARRALRIRGRARPKAPPADSDGRGPVFARALQRVFGLAPFPAPVRIAFA
jgi:membrane protein implicated in regulation of membrane protease activity